MLQELFSRCFFLAICFRADAVHPVGREVVALAVMSGQFRDGKVQAILLHEFGNPEGTIKNHPCLAGSKGILTTVHKAVRTRLVRGFKVGQKLQRLGTGIRSIGYGLAIIRIGLATVKPDQNFAPPVVILAISIDRKADTEIVAVRIRLGQLLGIIDKLVQRFRRTRQASLGKHVGIPEQGQRAYSRRQTPIFAINLHRANHREELFLNLGMRESRTGKRLDQPAIAIIIQPSVIELNNVRSVTGRHCNSHLFAIIRIREMRVLYRYAGVGCFKTLDQLVYCLNATGIGILPIFDFHRLGQSAPYERCATDGQCKS